MPSRYKKSNTGYQKLIYYVMSAMIVVLMIYGVSAILNDKPEKIPEKSSENSAAESVSKTEQQIAIEYVTEPPQYPKISYPDNSNITPFGEDIVSKSGVLVNITDNTIVAGRDAEKLIYPASMTKIMTLIVAAENMQSPDDTFTITEQIIAPLVEAEASRVGFDPGETVTVRDMLYGAALPSGADATVGLAMKICGSEEAFVELMNEKAKFMGLENTHFCNTSGLHDEKHYSTPVEMAMIMEYAMKNELCREVLSTYQYTTSKTPQHPQGIKLESTMFGRMYGNEVQGAQIIAGKTGYTDEAQNCLAAYGTKGGKEYISVTALSYDYWLTIHDAFNVYANYILPKTEINITPE